MINEVTLNTKQLERLADMIAEKIRPHKLMTTEQKAKQLGCSPITLRRWAQSGRIDSEKCGDNQQSRIMFREDAFPI